MKITKKIFCLVLIVLLGTTMRAQMAGVYTIPGSFASLAAAISSLNITGVSGAVVINIAAGYTETSPAGGYSLTATGTAVNPITFQKSGAGANPLITAFTGSNTPASAVQDGVWRLIGSDFITIDGIDITDANTANPALMEYGYGLFKASATNGCQNNTLRNCVITLNRLNNATGTAPAVDGSRGINMMNTLATTQTSNLTITSAAGSNSNNRFYSNTIQNCNIGIALIGFADVSPFTFADTNNDIGGTLVATGNTIINFGGGAAATNPAAAIRTLAQYNINVAYNVINNNNGSGVNHPATIRGIYLNLATSANASVLNNTLTITSGTAATQVSVIENLSGATAASNIIAIRNNVLSSCSNTNNTTGSLYGIYNNAASAAYLDISSNTFTNINTAASTGNNYLAYNTGAITNSISFNNNSIGSCTNTSTGVGTYYGFFNNVASLAALSANTNTFSAITASAATGNVQLIYNASATTGNVSMKFNVIDNCKISSSSSGIFYGIFNNGASSGSLDMGNNAFTNSLFSGTTGNMTLIYNTAAVSNAITMSNISVRNCTNSITSSGSYYTIYNNAGSTGSLTLSNNTFSNNTSAAASGSVHVIYNRGAATNTFNTIAMDNNLVINCTNSATGAAPYLTVYNSGVSATALSMSGNTITSVAWTTTTSPRYLVANTGSVSTGGININNNVFANLTSTLNTTGSFFGINTTGNCTADLRMNNNVFSTLNLSATSGTTNLLANTGVITNSIGITNTLFSAIANTATAAGDFYGVYNSGALTSTVNVSNSTFTNNTINSAAGSVYLINNSGAVSSTINLVNLSNNLVSNCTNSISSTGSFFAIYNNGASAANLVISNNTFTNCTSVSSTGATQLIYNRGVATNTFNSISITNNTVSAYTNSAASNGPFYTIYNNGVTSSNLDVSANTFTNIIWNTITSNRYMIFNSGIVNNSNTYTNNVISNLTNTLNTTGNFYAIANLAAAAANGSLTIKSNTLANHILAGTSGIVQLLSSSGVVNNAISITNNLVSGCNSSLATSGIFYGIYNASPSNANLAINTNTFINTVSSTTTGATYLVYTTASITTGVALNANSISGFTNTATSGAFYGVYNAGASASVDASANTFTNMVFATTASNRYMLYNTGVISASTTFTNNIVSNLTNSLNTTGVFYGINNAVGAAATASLTISNNTLTANNLSATSGGVQLISSVGTINNTITITNNLVSNYTSSISTTGNFIGISNGSASNANLVIAGNTFNNINSSISTGGNYYVYNTGAATNSISLTGNLVANCTNTANAAGTFYGVYNNAASSGNLDISANTFTNNYAASTTGSALYVYNRGATSNTFNAVSITNNLIAGSTQSATSGNVYSVFNSGVTAGNLSVANNTVINNAWQTLTANRYLVYNGGPVTGSISIVNNLFSNCTSANNTTGVFFGILNGSAAANLDISNNTFTTISSAATSGTMHLVYNSSAISNVNTITGNTFNNCVNLGTTTAPFYGVYNNATTSSLLNISSNTFTNCASTSSTGLTALIYNTGAASNTITVITVTNNILSRFTNSATANGVFYGIFNNLVTSGDLTIGNNNFNNQLALTTISAKYVIYNTGQGINSINITGNSISSGDYTHNTTGATYGIFNNAASPGFLNIDSNSFLNNAATSSTTGPMYMIYNNAAITGSTAITSNSISGTTFSTSVSGNFYGIYNLSANSAFININNNYILNNSVATNTVPAYMIYNTGVAATTVTAISISNNALSNFTNTITATAAFYGIFNNLVSSSSLNMNGNSFANHVLNMSTSPRYMIYNTGSVTAGANMSNNSVSGGTYTTNTTGAFYGIYNAAACPQGLTLSSNTFSNNISAATTGSTYLVYNTGASTATVNVNDNLIAKHIHTVSGTGGFYGLYNNGSSSSALSMNTNTIINSSVSTASAATYLVYSTGPATATINRITLNNNAVSNFTHVSSGAPFYGVYNNAISSADLRMNGNAFTGNNLSSSAGDMLMVYNNTAVTNTITMNNNSILNGLYSSNFSASFYGVYNTGTSSSNLGINTNTFSGNSWLLNSGNTYLAYNTAAITNTIFMNNNVVANSTHSVSGTGLFYSIYNDNAPAINLNMNGNTFLNNASNITLGNTAQIFNTGAITGSISVQNNSLGGFAFNNAASAYFGTTYGICNMGGAATTSMNVSGNSFSNYSFPVLTGLGSVYFIYNSNNNADFLINNNVWNNLSVNNSAGHYLIYNASATQSLLTVNNNSIVTGYNRSSASAGQMYGYYSAVSAGVGGSQVFSGNNFSNVTATVSGIGSFYGIYSGDGALSSMPQKTMFNNVISNITYNSSSNFIGLYLDNLGDASSLGTSAYNNTVSAINWGGGIYGLYTGHNVSPNVAANLYSNVITGLTSTGVSSAIFPALLGGNGAGLNFYKNSISDIIQNGTTGVAHGIYLSDAANTTLYNNLVGNISTPHSAAPNSVNGIYIATGSVVSAYYNTVYLNASSTGANFSSNAIFASVTSGLTLKNNIFINNSTPAGSGIASAFKRSGSNLATYLTASDHNSFYAGVPSASHVIYTDGSVTYQALPSLQAAIAPRDANSITENTGFLSTLGSNANFLHVNPILASLTENGAINITSITDDVDGQPRQGNPGYAGTGSAPDIGADEYDQNLPPCSSANAGTVSPASSTKCSTESVSFHSDGYTTIAAGGILHQWRVSSTPGGPYTNVTGGGGANTVGYTTPTLSPGTYYYILVTTCAITSNSSTSNQVSVTVNPLPTASVSVPVSTLCSGGTLNLNGASDIGTSFLWAGPNNYVSSSQNPVISNVNTNASGNYSLYVSNATCTNVAVTPFILVSATPPPFVLTPSLTGVCVGSSQTVSASAALTSPTLSFGTQANQNSATGYPSPYSAYYGGQKMQMLIQATELAAAGFINGSPITSLQFPVVALGGNWGTTINDCENFRINIGHTTLSSLATFQTGLTNVLITPSFTPTVGYANMHNFLSPFIWDGVSNVVIETSFSNNIAGTPGNAVIGYNSPTSFQSTIVYRADNATAQAVAAATAPNINVGVARPDFRLNGLSVGSYSWFPATGLSSTTTQSTIVTPSVATVYTVTLFNAVCSSTATTSLTIVQMPTLSVVSTSSVLCAGNSATITASGALSYSWSSGSHNAAIGVSPSSSTTYTVTGQNTPCPAVSATASISVSPAVPLVAAASSTNVCFGDSIVLSATGATSYTWSTGATTSSISVTPVADIIYTVTGASGMGCIGRKTLAITSASLPVIAIEPPTQTICAFKEVDFIASGANTYTWLPGGLNLPAFSDYPSITTTYTVIGQASNGCTTAAQAFAVIDACTGIQTQAQGIQSSITVFPNPSHGIITATFDFEGSKEIRISNAVGALLRVTTTTGSSETYDLSDFAKGVYFVKITGKQASADYRIILTD